MIATSETLATFARMLTIAGFDKERPDPLLAWRVFKDFAEIPVECAEDGLLFQCGTFSFTGERLFHLNFTRQFTHEEDGEYTGMEQLGCTILYPTVDELRVLSTNLWSFHCTSLAAFFARVETLDEFQIPTGRATPLRAEIDQEDI